MNKCTKTISGKHEFSEEDWIKRETLSKRNLTKHGIIDRWESWDEEERIFYYPQCSYCGLINNDKVLTKIKVDRLNNYVSSG